MGNVRMQAKKKNKKGKTLTLTDFLADDGGSGGGGGGGGSGGGGGGGGSTYAPKPVNWADETDDLEGDVSTTWHSNDDDAYRAPPIDRSILPTAPRAAREPNVDRSRLPKSPPFTAFLGNLPYDVTEESIQKFFRGLNISAVRLPREPSNPERLKGFGYAEFDDLDSLLRALSLNEESLGNRRIRVDIADQAQDKDRDERSFGRDRDRNRESDKTDSSDWRARPSTDSFDDYPPRRGDDSQGDRYRSDRYESDRYRDGPRRDGDRYERDRGRDRYDDRNRSDYDRGYDSRGGRRAFGSGYRRDDDYRGGGGGGDRYGDRYEERREDRSDRWNGYSRNEERREERAGPTQRPKLNLKPRTAPKDEEGGPSAATSRAASIFGGAKPVDTAAREREVEERLQKEQEKMQQRQLEDDRPRQIERKPRERHPSWRSDENQERSRTGSESSQTATGGSSSRISRRRESEKSVENEVFGKDEDAPSPSSKSPKSDSQLPLKVMPAPPPKENAWVKRSTAAPSSRSHSSEYSQSGEMHPDERRQPGTSHPRDENKVDALEHLAKSGGHGVGDRNRAPDKKEKRDLDSQGMPESKKMDEQAVKFSHASKYAALSMDGEEETEEYAD
uniref:Eukaryotic translation initiation factor 4B n=1 Tax=Xenopus tropicalis TaxID=8364 RepID=A0A6I8S7X0_XENTR